MKDTTPARTHRQPYPLRARLLTVSRIQELSPSMRRITLSGEDLESTLPFAPMSVADHVKVIVPDETTGNVALPVIVEDRKKPALEPNTVMRTYTIRAFDPIQRELTLDFVLHEHGPAGRWAMHANVGDALGVLGPRGSTIFPDSYAHYVIAADETAMPAAERWIEGVPEAATLDVFVLVEDAGQERELPTHPGIQVHWLHRDAGDDLAKAVQQGIPTDDGSTFVWAAAESNSMKPLRCFLREDAEFDPHSIDIHGYWRVGVADHHEKRRNKLPHVQR